jgi:hypothetical protein
MKYGKYLFHLQKKNIASFHVFGLFIPKKSDALEGRLSRGVAVRVLGEFCMHDISAILGATDLRFRLPIIIWAGLMHLILRILKF